MDKKKNGILTYVIWTVLAVVLIYFCFRSVEWDSFLEALRNCRWEWVALSMLTGAAVIFFRALRWQMQLRPLDPSVSLFSCFSAYAVGMASSLVLPRLGDVVRCGYIVRSSKVSFDKSIGTMVVDRLWDAVSLLAIGGIMVAVLWNHFGTFIVDNYFGAIITSRTLWIALAAVVLLLVLGVFLLWRMREKGGIWNKAWEFVRGIKDGLLSIKDMRQGYMFIVYTVIIWVGYWFMCHSILLALADMEAFSSLGWEDSLFLMFAGSVSSIVPVPGGFGAYHGAVAGALSAIWGIAFPVGMIFATLAHESQVIVQAVCGLGSYVYESYFRK
ncbi:MAG: flippase-like domain-containing protein [Bacteroidales bacterium]|nr:flippase-like domain-containing protein [Bacteroidales bacterium]